MYGTVARMKVQPGKLEELRRVMDEAEARPVEGFLGTRILVPNEWRDEVLMVVFFADRERYEANADDPRMHEDYLRYRALLDADPEWIDGEWIVYEP